MPGLQRYRAAGNLGGVSAPFGIPLRILTIPLPERLLPARRSRDEPPRALATESRNTKDALGDDDQN